MSEESSISHDLRDVSPHPTKEDIFVALHDISPNKIEGGYKNALEYLNNHFHLLREDFIRPLRAGVDAFKNPQINDPRRKAFRIYYNVYLENPRLSQDGWISFAMQKGQNCNTNLRLGLKNGSHARFLKYGTLLCLSNDNFCRNIYIAVVNSSSDNESYQENESEDSYGKDVNEDCPFTIQFTERSLNSYIDGIHDNQDFVALEPTAYFESYYHTLIGLQNLAKLPRLPMEQYIVRCETEPLLPEYMMTMVSDFLFCNKTASYPCKIDIRKCSKKVADNLGMNPSQFEAYIAALTQKFSVIQGPPGTGKTYIGLCIVRTLLHNFYGLTPGKVKILDKPILVVCFTNHALDQFLEGILKFLCISDLIRIGDRSKSEKLEECNVKRKTLFLHKDVNKAKNELSLMKRERSVKAINILEGLEPGKSTILYHTVDYLITSSEHQRQLQAIGEEFVKKNNLPDEYTSYAIWVWLNEVSCMDEISFNRREVVKRYRKRYWKRMTKEEAEKIDDIRSLDLEDKWKLYMFYLRRYEQIIKADYKKYLCHYLECDQRLKEISNFKTSEILKRAKIIGMTTTGAARYQKALQYLQPPIVIVEEAAEVLEAHLLTSISSECQHLILIGDHKQLRPSTSDYEIRSDYKLEVSLFERMVRNKFPFKTLNRQHRMRPEISALVRHVYDRLDDHQSVEKREAIRGMKSPVFLFNHSAKETSRDNSTSKSNQFEVEMIYQLVRYLTREKRYGPEQITVISMYSDQLFLLKDILLVEGVLVTTVDNYQGEENDIIIISTVRNNDSNDLGFVATENRICVCLSRAKFGLFALGNFAMLSKKSALWKKVVETASRNHMVGDSFVLWCEKHGDIDSISTPTEFKEKMSKRCGHDCGAQLSCGHLCARKCHFDEDKDHTVLKCGERCSKILNCGHQCQGSCSEQCPPCTSPVQFRLLCGHTQTAPCPSDVKEVRCKARCNKKMDCGHLCGLKCYQQCDPKECVEKCDTLCVRCKAHVSAPCNEKDNWACADQCLQFLDCGHPCRGTCQLCKLEKAGHIQCKSICGALRKCQHKCTSKCRDCYDPDKAATKCEDNPCNEKVIKLCGRCKAPNRPFCHLEDNFLCEADLTDKLPCGHDSTQTCHKWSIYHLCKVKVNKVCRRCTLTTEAPCSTHLSCNHSFTGQLPCGHDSKQTCSKWSSDVSCSALINWPCKICGSVKKAKCSEKDAFICQGQCTATLDCGHNCEGTCKECVTSGHHKVCKELCDKVLPCGHLCKAECSSCQKCEQGCQSSCFKCDQIIEASCSRCGRVKPIKCSETNSFECDGPCIGVLDCTHTCQNTCSSCSSNRGGSHSACNRKCKRKMACGHRCTGICAMCDNCLDGCSKKCQVKPCTRTVEKTCDRCKNITEEECSQQDTFSCKRDFTDKLPCGHESTQPCDKWTENAQCQWNITLPCMVCREMKPTTCSQKNEFACDAPCTSVLKCGHQCSGSCKSCSKGQHSKCQELCKRPAACGHPCQSKCHECEKCKDTCQSRCFKCEVTTEITCKRCWKKKIVACFEKDTFICDEPCTGQLKCGHQCKSNCSECPSTKGKRHPPCSHKCINKLTCGHACTQDCSKCFECRDLCSEKCSECEVSTSASCRQCGTVKRALCKQKDDFLCNNSCKKVLICGHVCPGSCFECKESHQKCEEICGKLLKCGHTCVTKCIHCPWRKGVGTCQACTKKCNLLCSHDYKCKNKCGEPCKFSCNNRCSWGCEHNKCKHYCSSRCAHKLCEKSCQKTIECRKCEKVSNCMGVCGEDCPELCKACDHEHIVKSYEMMDEEYHPSKNDVWVFLKDCKHSFPVKYIDELIRKHFKNGGKYPLLCPLEDCDTPVLNTGRYIEHTRNHQLFPVQQNMDKQNGKKKANQDPQKHNQDAISNTHVNMVGNATDLGKAKGKTQNPSKNMAAKGPKTNGKDSANKSDKQKCPAQLSEENTDGEGSPHSEVSEKSDEKELLNLKRKDNVSDSSTNLLEYVSSEICAESLFTKIISVAVEPEVRENSYYGRKSTQNALLEEFSSMNATEVIDIPHLPPPPPIKNVERFKEDGFISQLAGIDKVLDRHIRKK